MGWTPELIKDLKKLWKKGLTTGEIGRLIGMSKNAVVGKAHRLGLESRPSPIRREKVEVPKVKKSTAPVSKHVVSMEKQEKESQAVQLNTDKLSKPSKKNGKVKGVKLVDLKPTSCRWPEGDPKDPDFHFCGKEALPGKSYCEEHSQVAYSGVFKAR